MADHDPFDTELHAAFDAAYDLERELTGGGMSRVFLAKERQLNRQVVIKVLPPELAAGVNRERFRREIQLAAQLQHPHIVPLYAAGEHGELLYYTMPFIEGESLKHALTGGTRFSPRDVIRILHDVVDALAYAHTRGVIHRDIKPGNVLRSGSHAVVTDFGVAKAISAAMPAVGMTTSGMAIGTPAYMAPEQLAGDPAADHRVDIYAVGLLAYELLTGDAPFTSSSPQETMAAQLTRDPKPIETVRSDVPPALNALVLRCLAKMPEKRPQSAAELLAALDAIATPSGDYAPVRPARRGVGIVLAGALALFTIFYASRRRETAPATPAPDTTAVQAPTMPLLTRAESLAIAKAVEKKIGERTGTAGTDSTAGRPVASTGVTAAQLQHLADSLRADLQKTVIDSFFKMQQAQQQQLQALSQAQNRTAGGRGVDLRGDPRVAQALESADRIGREFALNGGRAPMPISPTAFADRAGAMGGPRRLFVSIPSEARRSTAVGASAGAIMDSLRKALSRNKRYIVIDRDSVRDALARTRTTDSIAKLLNVELFASLYPTVGRDSSVQWTLTLRDLTAHPAFGSRSTSVHTRADSIPWVTDTLIRAGLRMLDEIDRAPRRRDDPTTRVIITGPGGGAPTVPLPQPTPAAPATPVKKP
jgi:serine/threonine-protein kinase